MDERGEKVVEQAIACGIQRGRELYTGSCFDRALRRTAEALGVPLTEELLWELDRRLDALVATHNSLGVLPVQTQAVVPSALPLRSEVGPSPLATRRLEARLRALLADDVQGEAATRKGNVAWGRRCLPVAVLGLLLGAYSMTPHGHEFATRGYGALIPVCRHVRAAAVRSLAEPPAEPASGSDVPAPEVAKGTGATAAGSEVNTGTIPADSIVVTVVGVTDAPSTSALSEAAAVTSAPPPPEAVAEPLAKAPEPPPPSAPNSGLQAVNPGMSRAMVTERLGPPRMAVGSGGKETLLYPFGRVVLANGVVTHTAP